MAHISRCVSTKLVAIGLMSGLLISCGAKKEVAYESAPAASEGSVLMEEVTVTGSRASNTGRRSRPVLATMHPAPVRPAEPVDRSEYPNYTENSVKVTAEEPVSTFSIDVDTSSYSLMRASLTRGVRPQANMIRTEELVNYFDYDYALPSSKDQPFKPHISVFDSPWSKDKKLVRIGIKGYDLTRSEIPDSNLVFLLDVSGSMNDANKLPLVKKSFELLLRSLKPTDYVSIVVYAGASGVVLEPTQVKNKVMIRNALDQLSAGGSTAGGAGLSLAYDLAKQNFKAQAVNRIILATDGDFNVGQSSNEELKAMVERNRKDGVYLSVLGFGGYNYQDDMMQTIAQNGNGIAAYIDTLQEAKKVLVDEATSSLFPIAEDVKIQIEFNPAKVAEYRLLGYETRVLAREDFNNDKVDAGEVGAGHSVTAFYEITPTSVVHRSIDPLRYSSEHGKDATTDNVSAPYGNELGFFKLRYKLPGEDTSRLITQAILDQNEADEDALFATAVVGFAELLRSSKNTAGYTTKDVTRLARQNKGKDPYGYRAEFIRLVEMYQLLDE